MSNFNKVLLMGRLVDNVKLITFDGGSVAKFALAESEVYTDKAGEKQENTLFIECQAFGKKGEVMNTYLKKGRSVFIEGKLVQDKWEDKESGQKRSKIIVTVEDFQFIGGKPAEEGSQDTKQTKAKPAPRKKDDIPF